MIGISGEKERLTVTLVLVAMTVPFLLVVLLILVPMLLSAHPGPIFMSFKPSKDLSENDSEATK